MRSFIYFFVFLGLFGCTNNSPEKSVGTIDSVKKDSVVDTYQNQTLTADRIILPGEKVGHITIEANAADLDSILGAPDRSDAAMGKAWLTWMGKRDDHNNETQLDIYTTYSDSTMSKKTVQQIRTTSSYFSTVSGIHVYSDLEKIREAFPPIQKVATYREGEREFQVYDDREGGIAFEIVTAGAEDICTGIIVHLKGKPVTDTYMYLHPDMQLMNGKS